MSVTLVANCCSRVMVLEQVGALLHSMSHTLRVTQGPDGKVIRARCRDRLSGSEIDVYAKVVINATGAFADDIRRTFNPE